MEAYEIYYFFYLKDDDGKVRAAREFRQVFCSYERAYNALQRMPATITGFKGQIGVGAWMFRKIL